ncbi:hypothetical protein BJ875DRAFT_99094 [Amylocarpus encephaloides]|uniref:Secreted protein n=1 Tax=Amylocarpus encephaloides TaxID=45428 RepID=A0A9P8C307_9HELO|nr:hypothetical protein BJ875DRAFT_99094 [Amylocarpus encephaloides]
MFYFILFLPLGMLVGATRRLASEDVLCYTTQVGRRRINRARGNKACRSCIRLCNCRLLACHFKPAPLASLKQLPALYS